jgi:hypothetical protein
MKTQVMITLDIDLVKRAREEGLNMSQVSNDALKQRFYELAEENDPDLKEKKLKEELVVCQQELEAKQKRKTEIEKHLNNLDKFRIEYAEKAKAEAQEKIERYKKAIKQEIGYWPVFKKQGVLATQKKRESFFKQRAKILGITYADYLTEVVEPAQTAHPVVL